MRGPALAVFPDSYASRVFRARLSLMKTLTALAPENAKLAPTAKAVALPHAESSGPLNGAEKTSSKARRISDTGENNPTNRLPTAKLYAASSVGGTGELEIRLHRA